MERACVFRAGDRPGFTDDVFRLYSSTPLSLLLASSHLAEAGQMLFESEALFLRCDKGVGRGARRGRDANILMFAVFPKAGYVTVLQLRKVAMCSLRVQK